MNKAGKILVTGASGFVGQHLLRLLLQAGFQVVALDVDPNMEVPAGVDVFHASLVEPLALWKLPRKWWGVAHLAAISVPSMFSTPAPVLANLQMTMNLLEHLDSARVLLVSSCHVYAPSKQALAEEDPIAPQGRYGLSKHLCEQLAAHYRGKLDIRIARPFNHIGPGMPQALMVPSLVRRIAERAKGDQSPLRMHGTNSIRDFIDVRDVVAAYLEILKLNEPPQSIFNVCTGRPTAIADIVEEALGIMEMDCPVEFEVQSGLMHDIPFIVGRPDRLSRSCGWTPKISLAESLRHLLKSSLI